MPKHNEHVPKCSGECDKCPCEKPKVPRGPVTLAVAATMRCTFKCWKCGSLAEGKLSDESYCYCEGFGEKMEIADVLQEQDCKHETTFNRNGKTVCASCWKEG